MAGPLTLYIWPRALVHWEALEDIGPAVLDFVVTIKALFGDQRPLAAADDHRSESLVVKV